MKKGILFDIFAVILIVTAAIRADAITQWLAESGIAESIADVLDIGPNSTAAMKERLEGLPEEHYDNPFVSSRSRGGCRKLEGDVLITLITVSDSSGEWSENALEEKKAVTEYYLQRLVLDSREYGCDVRLSLRYEECTVDGSVSLADYADWTAAVLCAVDIPSDGTANSFLCEKYGVDEAPIIFSVNYKGRAFAVQSGADTAEYAYLFREDGDFRHELFHIFGAEDLYYPSDVKRIAEDHFPDSVMLCDGDMTVDPLTAYLVGWCDAPSDEAQDFLRETSYMTEEYLTRENKAQSYSGYGTMEFQSGVYTGDLLAGVPHGEGRMDYYDGGSYEGGWDNGRYHGKGTSVTSDGVIFEGDWSEGDKEGYGILRYSDGRTYEGYWRDDSPNGWGRLTDGGKVYDGQWNDGKFMGYGG